MAGNKNTVFDGKLKSRCEKLEDICSRDIRHVARSVSDVERILTERIQALEAKLKETAKHLTTECTFLAEAVDQTNNRLTKIESAGDDPQNTPAVAVVTQRPHTPASEIDSEAESEEEFRNTVSIFDEIMEAQRSPRQEIVEIHAITDDPPRETFETLPEESKKSFEKACEALKAFFESPKIRNAARQSLSNCRKSSSESVAAFANRLRPLVLAAMIGQNEEAFQNRLLDEFLDRLSPRQLAREVKLSDPETFEQALFKAQQVENLEVSERGSEIHLVKPLDHSHQAINELTERVNQIETNFAQAKRGGGRFRRGGDSRSNNRRWNNQGQRNNYSDRFRNNSNGQYGNSNNNRRYNPGNYERTNDGRPICNHCGKIGHFEQTCFRRLPPSDNPSQWNHRHQQLIVNHIHWSHRLWLMRPIFRNLMGFFNSAVVDFTDETPFRDFVAQLLKARKLESLELKDNWGGNYLRPQIELGRCPACITAKAPSPWIRNTLEEAFYQQSLVRLQLSFGYTHWASKVFLTNLVEGWLSGRFPATTKSVDILGGPDVDMLQRDRKGVADYCIRTA
ncbi:hypothetical protein QR680_007521 [Steinernema hermaphroditum]|uniref:CCHC-type domain-containing protein n=1 Tax=Steinernema hermaphroditum TaxID=289476 RepID=A0AA39IFL3_9BILA|nr:hypothetical protein QR680_007521 [Steinernema hermaphroditum]